ncbi:hypothetical protein K438DRAFT_1764078 [Mycena galopus ATCC 62051]|nr:hypothetical protein K438DRAFT_1764078 [Mycena galopus ATCC 62051]
MAKMKNPNDIQLDDEYARILPKGLQWINFFYAHFLGDLTQDSALRENAWGGTLLFLDQAGVIRHVVAQKTGKNREVKLAKDSGSGLVLSTQAEDIDAEVSAVAGDGETDLEQSGKQMRRANVRGTTQCGKTQASVRHVKIGISYEAEGLNAKTGLTLAIVNLWVVEAKLNTPFHPKHLSARLLHKLIFSRGEDYEYTITNAMELVGPSIAAQTAIQHLSSIPNSESDLHFLEMRNETLLIRMMICSASSLAHSLLSKGVLRILIKTLSYATGIMIWLVQNSCEALQVAMGRTTGVIMSRQVLEFGILAPLLRADKWHTRLTPAHFPNAPYIHSRLLIQTLATYTIYPCVLRAAAIAIEKVPVKLQAHLDKSGPMRAAWNQFKDVVRKRLEIPGAPEGPFDLLTCSNLFCPLLSPQYAEGAFKRCSGCGDVI